LLFKHALREPEFSERIEKFRADITAAAYVQIAGLVSDDGLARWAAQLAPAVAIEAVIGAALASDVDCSFPNPANMEGRAS
jgi:hypothetical protein